MLPSHPFLADPERARVYQMLCDCRSSSTHAWAKSAGWTQTKLCHFLRKLNELGLGTHIVLGGRHGSVFTPAPIPDDALRNASKRFETFRNDVDQQPAETGLPNEAQPLTLISDEPPPDSLGTSRLLQQPRAINRNVDKKERHSGNRTADPNAAFTTALVKQLNAGMRANPAIENLKPVGEDQHASVEASAEIIAAGVTLEFAKQYVWTEACRYKPKPPAKRPQIGSLKYLKRGLISAWNTSRVQRELRFLAIADEPGESASAPPPNPAAPNPAAAVASPVDARPVDLSWGRDEKVFAADGPTFAECVAQLRPRTSNAGAV